MSSQPPPSPLTPAPPPEPPPAPTAIPGLGDDLVREILLRLPDLPSLVRAAFACRAFRRAVRSSPAFRRSFRALHAPPLLALFLEPNFEVAPSFSCPWRRSGPDLVAADFSDIRLVSWWEIQPRSPRADGNLTLDKKRKAGGYSARTQELDLLISRPYHEDHVHLTFYTLSSDDGQGPSRVVCVRYEHRSQENTAFVFSSDTMGWQISRQATLVLGVSDRITTSMVVRGLICWRDWMINKIVLFDAVTCQFSLIDLPAPLPTEPWDASYYVLGETKDDKFCIVDIIHDNTLVSWFMTPDHDGVAGRWILYKELPLDPIVKEFTGCLIDGDCCVVELVAVISGYVYLSIFSKGTQSSQLYISLCLETLEISELFKHANRYTADAHPYVMTWPPSLVQNKEESVTEFTIDSIADDHPLCTEEASTVLVTALQSFGQALMNDSDSNKEIAAELDAFLGPTEDEEGSLISKITTLDAQLVTVRDRILRIRA